MLKYYKENVKITRVKPMNYNCESITYILFTKRQVFSETAMVSNVSQFELIFTMF